VRKILNGAVYDTETAKLIIESEHEEVPEDVFLLYRKKSGKYFKTVLACGYKEYEMVIRPISRQDAIIEACRMLSVAKARELFNEDEDNSLKQMNVRVTAHTYNIIRDTAAECNISMGAVLEDIVNGYDSDVPSFDPEEQYEQYLRSLPTDDLFAELEKTEVSRAESERIARESRTNQGKSNSLQSA
jgi:hypothetical protein